MSKALDKIGIDWVCEQITDGRMLSHIAREVGVSIGGMSEWLAKPENSARAREARIAAAAAYAEMAEEGIASAEDAFSLAKAKEMAHHLRWKASKMNPRTYGDKMQVGGAEDLPPVRSESSVTLTAEEAYKRMLGGNG